MGTADITRDLVSSLCRIGWPSEARGQGAWGAAWFSKKFECGSRPELLKFSLHAGLHTVGGGNIARDFENKCHADFTEKKKEDPAPNAHAHDVPTPAEIPKYCISSEALCILQTACEWHMVDMFADFAALGHHCRCITVRPKDLAIRVRLLISWLGNVDPKDSQFSN